MQNSAQVGYDWTKNKEMHPPSYLTSKKPNPCRVKYFRKNAPS